MMKKINVMLISAFLSFSFSGCSIVDAVEKNKNIAVKTSDEIKVKKTKTERFRRVDLKNRMYVGALSKEQASLPMWYFEPHKMRHTEVPLSIVIDTIVNAHPITVKYSEIEQEDSIELISIQTNTTVGDALKAVADTAGIGMTIEGDGVTFSKYLTKIIPLAFLPGDKAISLGKNNSDLGGSSASSISSSGGEYTTLTSQNDVVKDLEKSLNLLRSEKGKLVVDTNTMSVLIKDRPHNVAAIVKMIENMNDEATKMIVVDIQVLDVTFTNFDQGAIDWNLMYSDANGKIGTTSSLTGKSSSEFNPGLIKLEAVDGRFAGSGVILEALRQQGAVSKRVYPTTSFVSGTMARLRNVRRELYIQEQTNTNTANVGSSGGLKQAVLETGQVFNIFGKAFNDDVILRMTTNISANLGIVTKGSEELGVLVESPTVDDLEIDQTLIIEHGQTMMITGLKALGDDSKETNNGSNYLGLSKRAQSSRKETIILITARIVRGLSS